MLITFSFANRSSACLFRIFSSCTKCTNVHNIKIVVIIINKCILGLSCNKNLTKNMPMRNALIINFGAHKYFN